MNEGATAGLRTLELFRAEVMRLGIGTDKALQTASSTAVVGEDKEAGETKEESHFQDKATESKLPGFLEDAEASISSDSIAGRQKSYYKQTGVELSESFLMSTLERSRDETEVFIVADLVNLRPGFMYKFCVRAMNSVGLGEPSLDSYSVSTLPGLPGKPKPPVSIHASLTTITFHWDAPDDCGSAINGYRIWIGHLNRHVDVHRSCNTYKLDKLLPGRQYYMKVMAKNAVGFGEYSELNSDSDSKTTVAVPESPAGPMKPIAGTWNSITLEIPAIPYHNGSPIHTICVQKRVIETFSKGEWERPVRFRVPEDVIVKSPEPVRVPTAPIKSQFKVKLPDTTTWTKKSKHEPDPFLKSEVILVMFLKDTKLCCAVII